MEKDNETPPERILVLAPHPDDEVLGAGGSLNRYHKAGSEIMVVYMTDGSAADSNADAEKMIRVRFEETQTIARNYGFKLMRLDYKDGALEVTDASVKAVMDILHEFKPGRVYLPSFLDSHRDHFTTNLILCEVLKNSGSVNAEIFGYEISTNIPFPNYAVDITDQFEKKTEMVFVYKSQTAIFDYEQLCRARDGLNHTMYINDGTRGYAEVFLHFSASTYVNIIEELTHSSVYTALFS
jgi:LmbE family N-acetylglucosaminyl deacetylase